MIEVAIAPATAALLLATAPTAADLADGLLAPVLVAGRRQLAIRSEGATVTTKADLSPVTRADQESEAILMAALARLAPGIPIVAEEAMCDQPCPSGVDATCRFFLVDPLDGTREYVAGGDDFTVNVALIENGVPVFGLIYAPALAEFYVTLGHDHAVTAIVSPDATAVSLADIATTRLRTRPMPAHGTRTAILSRRDTCGPDDERLLANLGVATRIHIGSSLKFCRIARGAADVYPRRTSISEWDIAAGHAILAASGGNVRDIDGRDIIYGRNAPTFRTPGFIAAGQRLALQTPAGM